MNTTRLFSGLAGSRVRVLCLASAFTAATLAFVPPAFATLTAISLNPASLSLSPGASGSTVVTVTKDNSQNNSSAALSITWAGGTPSGVTASFSPASVSWGGSGGDQSSTLTITTTAATPLNTYAFTVTAQRTPSDLQTTSGTLIVALPTPTITFAAAPTPTYLGGNFSVSATTNSDGALTYGAVSGPCAVVNASAGEFSSSGAGTCVVQASTAATANWAAGAAQQSVTIAKAAQTITFGPLANKTVGDPDFSVSATASSGLTVTFTASGVCSVTGTTVSLSGAYGSCSIIAAQAGNENFLAAASVVQSFVVAPTTGAVALDLYAVANNVTVAGQSLPAWGYTSDGSAIVTPGGPPLVVTQGDVVVVTLHNGLSEPTSVLFQGQDMVPDITGAAIGTTKSYIFTATRPGTYLYEAGLLSNAQHQVAMGLYGALIVRPAVAPTQAYTDPATAFDTEAVLVLSEIDPALNGSADPAAFDMRDYAPRYFLINGKAYPDTDAIPTAPSDRLLLRYVNAGAKHHSMAVLGLRQNFVAEDAGLLPTLTHNVVAETLAPGQTGDAIVTVPAVATESRFAVYDGNLMLHNNGQAGFGGMLTFVTAGTGSATAGPATSNVLLTPNVTDGTVDVALTASIRSTSSNVTGAEYFIDSPGTNGGGTALSGSFGAPTVAVSGTIPTTSLAPLASGNHTIYVHGQDATGAWGSFSSAVLNLDKTGPTTSALTLTPNPTNGSVNLALAASASDLSTGGSNIAAAEYSIDGGAGMPMTVSPSAAKVASLTATIAAATVASLSDGSHTISVRSQDSLGNWGVAATIGLIVDKTGPATSSVTAAPNPSNGAIGFNATTPAVRIAASLSDSASNIAAAEAFIDTIGTSGTGIILQPTDGLFNSGSENAYVDVPLSTIVQLSDGNHTIYVHGKDAAGNWGATGTTTLVIDKTAPTITAATLSPNTIAVGAASVTLAVTAGDGTGSGVTGGQYWVDGSATPPATATAFTGSGTTIDTSALAAGTHTVYVRMRDAAGNWSAVSSATLYVVQAIDDARAITADGSATQTSDTNAAAGVLANDQPVGVAARTAVLASAPVRTSGTGAGTITLSCPAALGTPAAPAIGSNTVCTNGAYRVTLTGVGNNNNQRAASKRGTFQFTYTEGLNGVTSTATVTITVN